MDTLQALQTFLYEGQTMPALEWQGRLCLTDSFFRSLVADGIFAPSGAQAYRLNFVGVLFTGNKAFTVLPKIFRSSTETKDASLQYDVVACIRRYVAGVRRRTKYAEASEVSSLKDDGAKLIDVFLSLLDWTLDRGIHSERIETNGFDSSDIDWGATMRDGVPLHIGRSVVYSEITSRVITNRHGVLAHLQAKALLAMHQGLKPASLLWLNENDPILEMAADVLASYEENENDAVFTEADLLEYMNGCNQDHDKELAGILFEWMLGVRRGIDHPSAFGTTAFEYVWEDMCSDVVKGLGLLKSHDEIASQPLYVFSYANKKTQGQRPDILRQMPDGIVILDAKWYDVAGQDWPGTQDVIKQIMYQVSVTDNLRVIRNAFLVPTCMHGQEIFCVGRACMANSSEKTDERFPEVDLLAVPWNLAYAAYCGTINSESIAASILNPKAHGMNE